MLKCLYKYTHLTNLLMEFYNCVSIEIQNRLQCIIFPLTVFKGIKERKYRSFPWKHGKRW